MGQRAEELKSEIARTRDDLGGTLDAIGDRVSPGRIMSRRKAVIRNRVVDLRETVMGTVEGATSRISDAGRGMTGTASGAKSSLAEGMGGLAESARQAPEGNPLLAGALAFGFGLLVASVMPKTSSEQQAAGRVAEKLEPVKETLAEAGQQVASTAKEAGQEAMDEARSQATDAMQQVKQTVSEATDEVKSQAQSAAGTVKEEATSQAETVKSG